ncbi:MAG TPA: FAD-dependent monooxygenase [Burkholderiales bacterium]|nr:FAD-dependent monooxygenase [Burkholderiales bacterium]
MKVLVVGAGPAGLYLSYLLKKQRPDCEVRVLEQNPPDATFGFGVVFSDRALEFLQADDPATYERITPQLEAWVDLVVVHRGERNVIDGIGFAAIGRLHFLRLMQEQLASVGVTPEYGRALDAADRFEDYDLVVAADGANSAARRRRDFGTRITHCTNKFAWYGTPRRFEKLTQTFLENEHGTFNVHHYLHAREMSTFVTECDAGTWQRAGFATMGEDETRAYLERVYAPVLQGAPLVSNKSIWRNFPNVRNERWSVGNLVLIGDALRTAHFSIGSGTRLAMEDSIALVKGLQSGSTVENALRSFEAVRRPIVEKLVAAADASGAWYDRFPEHMKLAPRDFAWSYIQRSGRIDPARLRKISPRFVDG